MRLANSRNLHQAKTHLSQRLWQKKTPWQQPNQEQAIKQDQGDSGVIHGNTLAEVAQELLVHKVEPQKALGFPRRWIRDRRKNMPGRRNHKKNSGAGEKPHLENVAEVAN